MSQISQVIKTKPAKSFGFWLPTIFVLLTGGVLVAMIFGVIIYQMLYLDRIYPGVMVDGRPAGGMMPNEVMAQIEARSEAYLSRSITVQAGEEQWTFTPRQLGMWIDVAATANKAYAVGRQGNFLTDLLTQLELLSTPREIEPIVRYDTGPINETLQELSDHINVAPANAQLIIHPDGSIEVIPAQAGRRLHADATRAQIEAALFDPAMQPVTAVIQQIIPARTDADIDIARRQAENLLGQDLVFHFSSTPESAEWHLDPATLAEMIDLVEIHDESSDRPRLALEIAPEKFDSYVEEFAKAIKVEPIDAQLKFDTGENELQVLRPSQDGRTLDIEAVYQQLETLPDTLKERPIRTIELPVITIPPQVSSQDLDSLGIKELVSEATSYFKGSSEGRMHNIALSASKFNGVIVPPGEIFSFNKYLGEVNKETGYDESLIIYGNRTTVGIGGGVCQVSTTAFRAAFLGGFEIVERWAHGYRVGWYETNSSVGLDATVYSPSVDLKFRNDTDHYLLIQTRSDLDAGTVTFEFYGTKTGRDVIVSKPEITKVVKHGPAIREEDPTLPKGTVKQVDWAVDGMDVTITRTVKQGDAVLFEDVLASQYKPWRAVYKVGTGE